jgi:hypothetical protein
MTTIFLPYSTPLSVRLLFFPSSSHTFVFGAPPYIIIAVFLAPVQLSTLFSFASAIPSTCRVPVLTPSPPVARPHRQGKLVNKGRHRARVSSCAPPDPGPGPNQTRIRRDPCCPLAHILPALGPRPFFSPTTTFWALDRGSLTLLFFFFASRSFNTPG